MLFLLLSGTAAASVTDAAFAELCTDADEDAIREALEEGAGVKAPPDGLTPLQRCVHRISPALVQAFLRRGANVNAVAHGRTLLMEAALTGDPEVVRLLLPLVKDRAAADADGRTALNIAVEENVENPAAVAQVLLEGGVPLGGKGLGANLLRGIFSSDSGAVAAALEQGAGVGRKAKNGSTPLLWAAVFTKDAGLVEMLAGKGADVAVALRPSAMLQEREKKAGDSPIILAARHNPVPAVLSVLIRHGASVETRSPATGKTPLMETLAGENPEACADILLSAGAKVNAADGVGRTALMVAAGRCPARIVEKLLAAGAEVNAVDDSGRTALMMAAGGNADSGVVRALARAGSELNARTGEDFEGTTALMEAVASSEAPDVIRVLLELGADTGIRDSYGQTALERVPDGRRAWLGKNGLLEQLRPQVKRTP